MEADESLQPSRDELTITLFLASLTRPQDERDQFLREACLGDDELLASVRKRIQWEQRMNGFLMTPVLAREQIDRPFASGDSVLRGRYRILRVAGEGGMGVVYEAFDEKLQQRVALKCPRFEFRKRLAHEARKSLQVIHTNVCRVFEIHTEETSSGEVDFLTMELLEGETLAARLERLPTRWLQSSDGLIIARQICAGLRAVHDAGIIHRDLKAGNVMLTTSAAGAPRAVIMDFGIAQDNDVFHSAVRGTPAYVAPELWMGQRPTVRSDIYALGVLLHEMAAGGPPFPNATPWQSRLHDTPRLAAISEPVRGVLRRCLEADPAKRFASIAELEAQLFRRSRRSFFYAAASIAACAVAGAAIHQKLRPTSPVRLALLPARGEADGNGEWTPMVNGFLHDLSYRFKTLRRVRRPITVFTHRQAAEESLTGPSGARNMLGATHALTTQVSRLSGGWSVSAELVDTSSGKSLRRWDAASDIPLTAQLFALQSRIVVDTIDELVLRAEPKTQSLSPAAYADYIQGLHYARVDYENAPRALPYFERVIATAPDSALGYAGMAEALLGMQYRTGDRSLNGKALTFLEKAEQLDPESTHVHLVRGRLNMFMNLYERALADFRRATELEPAEPQAWLGVSWALAYLGRNQEAELAFQSAIAPQPDYYKPHLEAGIFYWEMRDLPLAERHWREAIRLNPSHTRAKLNLAILCLETDRLAEAEQLVYESLKLKRELPALELLGDLQYRQGKYNEAIASYEEALRNPPPEYKTWGALAAVLHKAGREAEAIKALRKGLADAEAGLPTAPRDQDRLSWCAFYSAMLGNAAHARQRAGEALAVSPVPTGRVRKRVILTYDALHDTAAALRLMEGAPQQLLREIARSPSLSAELQADRRFLTMIGK